MSTILEIQNVSKKYGSFTALNNISLKIKKGSIFGLLGPNGAGKTSLIRIINQIISKRYSTTHYIFQGLIKIFKSVCRVFLFCLCLRSSKYN